MTSFMTTQEVQELLHVDRSTVYRMAEDGRLPSVKVGRQWRFPADQIAARLGTTDPVATPASAAGELPHTVVLDRGTDEPTSGVTPEIARTIATLLGDLFGVMAVVTDELGRPLTPVANPCGLYSAIADEPATADACLAEWQLFAERPQMAQRFSPSHLGFLCTRSFLWVERRPVAMLLVGGITPPDWPPSPSAIAAIADSVGVAPERLAVAIDQTYDVDEDRQRWILDSLAQLGDLLSLLLAGQQHLRATLDAITRLASPAIGAASPN